ncbi:hypothetical protein [Mesorhizobium sp. M4B.F.Ca.ET.058.02.1.1]|uniref:hypothetical protein n=1 Tax=Mesorhizobium sp. M4B.F.Ca.ET.058.02.1.1 TaxID=2493675 RepID=UPI00167ECE21|nr:hypothetical protein [Mesorhizobium sp. M4B.F.Ca.ET.058.02.1.1]
MSKPRYYHTTVGQDHIPDRWKWLDVAIPYLLIAVACGIDIMVLLSLGWRPT